MTGAWCGMKREKNRGISALKFLGLLLLATATLFIVWRLPEMALPELFDDASAARTEALNDSRRTLAQSLAGIGLLFGLYLTNRRIRAMEDQVAISLEGQVNERFSKGVEQIGSQDLAVRVGGMYALENVARNHASHHWVVAEVLAAYVRENLRLKTPQTEDRNQAEEDKHELAPPTDVQVALYILGRRLEGFSDSERAEREGDRVLFLDRSKLAGADLYGADFAGAFLSCADLRQADLRSANLKDADLHDANLVGASLLGLNLNGCDLRGADLTGAKNVPADLHQIAILDERTKH